MEDVVGELEAALVIAEGLPEGRDLYGGAESARRALKFGELFRGFSRRVRMLGRGFDAAAYPVGEFGELLFEVSHERLLCCERSKVSAAARERRRRSRRGAMAT
jgi:hypothetical protein